MFLGLTLTAFGCFTEWNAECLLRIVPLYQVVLRIRILLGLVHIFVFVFIYTSLSRITFGVLQKPWQGNFRKFQKSGESRFGGSEKDRKFFKIPKGQYELARYYKQWKLAYYFLNNAAKTCLYGPKISENIKVGHFFQSWAFFHLISNIHTNCLSAFNIWTG